MKYSVIIPVYNGEETVEALFEKTNHFFEHARLHFEMIFVHDCGPDNSWEVLTNLKQKYSDTIKLIKLSRNYGQHNAIICGIENAHGDFVITMDEDLQHNPQDIKSLIAEQAKNDYDVVYGNYEMREHSFVRNTGSWFLKKMIAKSIPNIHPDYSAFRLIKMDIAKALVNMQNSYTFLDGYIAWITTHCGSCTVSHAPRQGGKSAYNVKKLVRHLDLG
jgi:undecaprenyl-phosphate 4-deoxy-4-formamido-L-arabinose transferase